MHKAIKCTYVLKDTLTNSAAYSNESDTYATLDQKVEEIKLMLPKNYAQGFEKNAIFLNGMVFSRDPVENPVKIYEDGQEWKPDMDAFLGKSVYTNFNKWDQGDSSKIIIKTDTIPISQVPFQDPEIHVGTLDVLIGYQDKKQAKNILKLFSDFVFGADQIKEQPIFDVYDVKGIKKGRTKRLMRSFGINGDLKILLNYQGRLWELDYSIK